MKNVNEILRYFDAKLIGSVLLYNAQLLSLDEINDVDINVKDYQVQKVRAYLNDNGFKETKPYYQQRGYEAFQGSLVFEKEGEKTIHLLVTKDLHNTFTIGELIGAKFTRQTISDLKQIATCVINKQKTKA